jgi:hypothetical protein
MTHIGDITDVLRIEVVTGVGGFYRRRMTRID